MTISQDNEAGRQEAVQDYVDGLLANIDPTTGVSGTVVHKSGDTYTVTLSKGSDPDPTTETKDIDMTFNVLAETDAEAVARAEGLVKDGTASVAYSNQTQADKTKAVEDYVKGLVKGTGVDVAILFNSGTGQYEVTVDKGVESATKTIGMTITVDYKTLEGDNQVIKEGTNTPLTFKTEGEIDAFLNLYLNGKLVDKTNYSTESGSVIFTLASEYVKSLPAGEHVFRAEFIDGSATINIEVAATGAENNKNPETGDSSNIILFLGAMIISLGGIGTVVYRRKRAK